MSIEWLDYNDIPGPSEPEWLWYGYLALRHVTMLVAPEKVGKSTFLFDLLYAANAGQEFLGQATYSIRPILLTEESQMQIKRRNKKRGHLPMVFAPSECVSGSWLETLRSIAVKAAEEKSNLVIIDTLAVFSRLKDENDNAEASTLFDSLRALTRGGDFATLVIHHTRKDGGSYRGAGAIGGAVDQLVFLESPYGDNSNCRRLRPKPGRLVLEEPMPTIDIEWTPESPYHLLDGAEKGSERLDEELSDKEQEGLCLLSLYGLSDQEVAKQLGVSRMGAWKLRKRLEERGLLNVKQD